MPVDFTKVIGSASYNPNPTPEEKVRQYLTQVPSASASMKKATNNQQSNGTAKTTKKTTTQSTSTPATKQTSTNSTTPSDNWRNELGEILVSRANKSKSSKSKSNQNLVDAAQNYLGTPYVYGGESMDEGGMDCSGFVYNALNDAGYKVGRTTAQGYRAQGKVVKKSEMQPGDLIFFGTGNDASHIGIYIGNGQMIHSAGRSSNTRSNPGKGVSIVNVDHRSDFIEARRYSKE